MLLIIESLPTRVSVKIKKANPTKLKYKKSMSMIICTLQHPIGVLNYCWETRKGLVLSVRYKYWGGKDTIQALFEEERECLQNLSEPTEKLLEWMLIKWLYIKLSYINQ